MGRRRVEGAGKSEGRKKNFKKQNGNKVFINGKRTECRKKVKGVRKNELRYVIYR